MFSLEGFGPVDPTRPGVHNPNPNPTRSITYSPQRVGRCRMLLWYYTCCVVRSVPGPRKSQGPREFDFVVDFSDVQLFPRLSLDFFCTQLHHNANPNPERPPVGAVCSMVDITQELGDHTFSFPNGTVWAWTPYLPTSLCIGTYLAITGVLWSSLPSSPRSRRKRKKTSLSRQRRLAFRRLSCPLDSRYDGNGRFCAGGGCFSSRKKLPFSLHDSLRYVVVVQK